MEPIQEVESGRTKLLRAAGEHFIASSYTEASVAKILASSGFKPPTLYYHFGDKEGLYLAWLEGALGSLGERIRAGAALEASVDQGLLTAASALIDPAEPDVVQLRRDARFLAQADSRERLHRMVFEAVYEPIMGVFVRAAATGRVSGESFDRMTQTFIMGALGLRPAYSLHPADSVGAAVWWADRFIAGMAIRPQT